MKQRLTVYPGVAEIIQILASGLATVLADQLEGIYVHGSLALGDFNPASSDIDFMAITKQELDKQLFRRLADFHQAKSRINNPWATRLEGSYVNRSLLSSKQPPSQSRPYLNGEQFSLAPFGFEWLLELYTLREYGIVVSGPDPRDMIPPICKEELQRSSIAMLKHWWAPMVANPQSLEDNEYQAYAIFSMCRILYMYHNKTMVSKLKAANWAQATLRDCWQELIAKALSWEKGLVMNCFDETVSFIQFTLDHVGGN